MQREHGVQSGTGVCQESKTCPHDSSLYMAADRGFQPAIDAINKNRIPRPERKE